jgi:formate dehydrogenase iron-sulfur subunit
MPDQESVGMMMKSLLIDTTKCIGCRACQVACKRQNRLSAEKAGSIKGSGYQNPRHRSSRTWNLITYNEIKTPDGFGWEFGRRQCFHCLEPACVTACPVGALYKKESGAVCYDASRCIGCRYCQIACPFNAPRFEWDKAVPEIKKCDLCDDLLEQGSMPACSSTCPTGAIKFGNRQELIEEARTRIADAPDRYVNHIYGEKEIGGTCVMHLAGVPFESMGYVSGLSDNALSRQIETPMRMIPFTLTSLAAVIAGLFWIMNRREEVRNESEEIEGEQ